MRRRLRMPGLERLRAFTSVAWPTFWRARYENALLILLGALVFVVAAPLIRSLDAISQSYGGGKDLLSVLYAIVVTVWLGLLAFFWMLRQNETPAPSHALAAVYAPGFITLLLFISALATLIFAGWIHLDKPDIWEAFERSGYLGKNSTGFLAVVIASALIVGFFKLRDLFGTQIAVGSMVAAVTSWALAGFTIYLVATSWSKAGINGATPGPQGAIATLTVAVPATAILASPLAVVALAFRRQAQAPISRFAAATSLWNAAFILFAALSMIVLVAAIVIQASGGTLGDAASSWPQGIPLHLRPHVAVGGVVALGVIATELAAWLSVRLLTLPER